MPSSPAGVTAPATGRQRCAPSSCAELYRRRPQCNNVNRHDGPQRGVSSSGSTEQDNTDISNAADITARDQLYCDKDSSTP